MSGESGGHGQQPGGQWGHGQQSPGPGYWPGYGQPGASGPGGWGQGPWGAVPLAPKPGVIPLRPLSFGEMFNAVFDTIRRYPKALYLPLLAVAGIGVVPVVLVMVLCVGSLRDALDRLPDGDEAATGQQMWDVMGPMLLVFLVCGLALLAVYLVAAPLSTVVLRAAALGRPMTTRQAWKEAAPRLWPAVQSEATVIVPMILAYVLALVAPIVLAVLTRNPLPMLFMLLLVPAVGITILFVTIRLTLQVPVLVLEETRPVAAVRRAWRLNEGNWWRSLLLSVVVSMAGRLAANVVLVPLWVVITSLMPALVIDDVDAQRPSEMISTGGLTVVMVLGALLMLLFTVVTAPLSPLANGVMYIDRRIRKERLDIALAEAAGIRLSDPAAQPMPPAPPTAPAPPAAAEPAAPAEPVAQPVQPTPEEPSAAPADAPSEPPAPSTKDGSGTS
ncbi:hypothetical protein [Kitasatospora griseola]|uniref:hypothetical protein n=1 Tax=Kitasatospora griseola TaxID=2064 RepID=UPI00382A2A6B